jgi:hypothetical protein
MRKVSAIVVSWFGLWALPPAAAPPAMGASWASLGLLLLLLTRRGAVAPRSS